MLEAWYESPGISANLFDESLVHQHVRCLWMDNTPATGAAAAKEAINLIGGLFNVDMVTSLRECLHQGNDVARGDSPTASPHCQYGSLSRERTLCCRLAPYCSQCLAGSAWVIPEFSTKNFRGTIDTKFVHHKTAGAGTGKALPISAPASGFSLDRSWALSWLPSRRSASLDASVDGTLLPASKAGGWHKVALSTPEFATAFRAMLVQDGCTAQLTPARRLA